MNGQGSCARGGGSVRAQTEVQVRARMRRAEALAAQSCWAQLRQWQSAVAKAERGWETQGFAGRGRMLSDEMRTPSQV